MRRRRSWFRSRWLPAGVLLTGSLLWLTGCQTAHYYAQAVRGQCQILARQQACEKLLKDPHTPPELKTKLELARQLGDFAERELSLPANGHYRRYADLGRPFVVWNVRASPRYSLAAKRWWYPFVGSLSYRGYFAEQDARSAAARLAAQGLDSYVEGVEAYSTLGWFRDPLLNTFIHLDEAGLAEVLFHELAHQRVFIPGDTDFNEAFATAVGQEGARRWLQAKGDTNELERYASNCQRERQFVQMVQATRKKLESLYGDERNPQGELRSRQQPLPSAELAKGKAETLDGFRRELEALRNEWGEPKALEDWINGDVNNARLNSVATYYDLVPGFQRILAASGGDLKLFYRKVKSIGKAPKEERPALLQAP